MIYKFLILWLCISIVIEYTIHVLEIKLDLAIKINKIDNLIIVEFDFRK
jgi:hypothetical protein